MKTEKQHYEEWKHVLPAFTETQLGRLYLLMEDFARDYHRREVEEGKKQPSCPEWLTDEIRALAKKTWNEHKDTNDGKRVEAMRVVQRGALAAEYMIGIKKAMELLQQHCL